jgi:hypothetical protein
MAYITVSNANQLVSAIKTKEIELMRLTGSLYKKPIYCFSKNEELRLKALRHLFSDPDLFLKGHFNKKITRAGSDKCILGKQSSQPAYHRNIECELLNADFINFSSTDEIEEFASDAPIANDILEILLRAYQRAVQNGSCDLADRHRKQIFERFDLDVKDIEKHYHNSGYVDLTTSACRDLEREIDQLIDLMSRYCSISAKHKAILRKYQKRTYLVHKTGPIDDNNTGYSDDDVRNVLSVFEQEFRRPLKKKLKAYYMLKNSPAFDEDLLDKLGFKPCSGCIGRKNRPSSKAGLCVTCGKKVVGNASGTFCSECSKEPSRQLKAKIPKKAEYKNLEVGKLFNQGLSEKIPQGDGASFEALRELRKSIAHEKGIPAYCVFSDKTLREMVASCPTSESELLTVYGVGKEKAMQYGDAFLQCLSRHGGRSRLCTDDDLPF